MILTSLSAVITASAQHEGSDWHLSLCRTLYRAEGSCILEMTRGKAKNGEPGATELLEYGSWRIAHHNEGPATLSIDLHPDDCDAWPALRRELMSKAFVQAGSWGAEAFEP